MEPIKVRLLIIASRVLSYPSDSALDDSKYIRELIDELDLIDYEKSKIEARLAPVYKLPLREMRETYVATFDLKSKLGLYLSAHEFGDSPKRGAALIKLQKIISEAGFERVDGELADYIPMLYEFLAIAEENPYEERITKRLACATQRILNHMPEDNPYNGIFSILMQYVFEPPTKEELEKLEQDREEADLEEMPYPIMYQ